MTDARCARYARRVTMTPRRPWIAALLAVLCNGLGHLYAAGLRAAVTVFLLWLVVAASISAAMRIGPAATIAAAAAALAFWVGQAAHAARSARRRAGEPRTKVSHPVALVAFYVATVAVSNVLLPRSAVPGPCMYAARSEGAGWREEPCVAFEERLDDRAYRTYCTPSLPCGDVPPLTVPEGMVWLAGDHRDHSADSRVYGPVPVRMILGEARWVIASWGPTGLRWDRFGETIR